MIRGAISIWLLGASLAGAQEFCDRPIPPENLTPPTAKQDAEFREFLNTEYRDYLAGAEAYINCLGREHQSIYTEMRAILDRWTRLFGEDARMTMRVEQ